MYCSNNLPIFWKNLLPVMRSEGVMTVSVNIKTFYDVMALSLVVRCICFGETCCLHFYSAWQCFLHHLT